MIFTLIKLVLGLIVIALLLGFARTWMLEHSASETLFLTGTAPNPAPDGFYRGAVPGYQFSWLGKTFDAAHSTGINVFDDGGKQTEKYPFATYAGTGVRAPQTAVLKIDYNIPAHPFWLRPILDEIVQIGPGQYLGKLQLRIVPGYPFTIVFFTLTK